MKNLLSLILILSLFSAIGQINPKTKWGQVSPEEIDYKAVDFDPGAAAVILFEEGNTVIETSFATTVYRRIKILNERGLEPANQEIRYIPKIVFKRSFRSKRKRSILKTGKL
ncbi:MAG: hypothetical protein WBF83_03970 [Moheibacter sp.]